MPHLKFLKAQSLGDAKKTLFVHPEASPASPKKSQVGISKAMVVFDCPSNTQDDAHGFQMVQSQLADKRKDYFSMLVERSLFPLPGGFSYAPPPNLISMISLLSWNIRGVGNAASLRHLKKLSKIHNISLLVLLEPMFHSSMISSTTQKMGFDSYFVANDKIWILWRYGIVLKPLTTSP